MGLEEQVIGFAFGAGILTFFSPCSIAMLPAYVSYYVGREDDKSATGEQRTAVRLSLAVLAALLGGALVVGSWLHNELRILGTNHFVFGLYDRLVALSGVVLLAAAVATFLLVWREVGSAALSHLGRSAVRGASFGLVTSGGFVTVFGGVGLLFLLFQTGPLASGLRSAMPLVSLVTALILFALGVLLFLGRNISWIPRVRAPRTRGVLSFYSFGLGYALVATGCLLPVFLLVVNAALLVPAATGAGALLAYALGSGMLMTIVSVYIATASTTSVGFLKRFRPYVKPVSGFVIMEMAAYIVWFDYVGILYPLENIRILGENPWWLLAIPPAFAALVLLGRRLLPKPRTASRSL